MVRSVSQPAGPGPVRGVHQVESMTPPFASGTTPPSKPSLKMVATPPTRSTVMRPVTGRQSYSNATSLTLVPSDTGSVVSQIALDTEVETWVSGNTICVSPALALIATKNSSKIFISFLVSRGNLDFQLVFHLKSYHRIQDKSTNYVDSLLDKRSVF